LGGGMDHWRGGLMPVKRSVTNVPDDLARCPRTRAARPHRSLHGELLAILEEAVSGGRRLSPAQLNG
jgi:plasmid stability protein